MVQFNRNSGSLAADFSGRIEHLNSGRRLCFDTPEEMVAAFRVLLGEVGRDSEGRN